MKLSILERLVLASILPPEGNFATLKIVRKLREALSLSEEEFKVLSVKQAGDNIVWDTSAEAKMGEVEIGIGEKATDIVVECLKRLDETGKLTEQHFSLYEKFVDVK